MTGGPDVDADYVTRCLAAAGLPCPDGDAEPVAALLRSHLAGAACLLAPDAAAWYSPGSDDDGV